MKSYHKSKNPHFHHHTYHHKKGSKHHSNNNSSSLSKEKIRIKQKKDGFNKFDHLFGSKKSSSRRVQYPNYTFGLKKHKSMYEFNKIEEKFHVKKKTRFSQN